MDFDIGLNIDNIRMSYSKMRGCKRAIERGITDGIDELKERTIQKLFENLANYGLAESNLAQSINVEQIHNGFVVSVGGLASDYAMYVEFGTGIVGANNPHPKVDGWVYDVNGHGEMGWWYPTTSADPNPTKKLTETGDIIAWTKGEESRPFFYDTWKWVKQSYSPIIRKHIRRELKKIGKLK